MLAGAVSAGPDLRALFHSDLMGADSCSSVLSPLRVSIATLARTGHSVRPTQHSCRHVYCSLTGSLPGVSGSYRNHPRVSNGHDMGAKRRIKTTAGHGVGVAFHRQHFTRSVGTI